MDQKGFPQLIIALFVIAFYALIECTGAAESIWGKRRKAVQMGLDEDRTLRASMPTHSTHQHDRRNADPLLIPKLTNGSRGLYCRTCAHAVRYLHLPKSQSIQTSICSQSEPIRFQWGPFDSIHRVATSCAHIVRKVLSGRELAGCIVYPHSDSAFKF